MTVLLILLASFPVRIAVFGDRTGSPDDVEFEIAINAIVEMSPDIVLSVGDFVEGNGDVETAREDWDNILPILERLTLRFPFVYTPGNNDIWNDQTENYWREYTSTEPYRTEEIYGITFVVWDTSRDDHLSMDDLDTIKSLMEEINTDNPWILVTHKPFWFMSYEDSAVVSDFKKLMTESGPLAVVGGHIHRFAADRDDGVLYISAGPSGSAIWEPDPEHGRFTQFGWMTIWPDSAAYAVVDARGIYSETINTGEEMNLFYLYRNEMFAGRQLEMELESAVLTLRPVEDRTRTVRLSID
ncbi:MAG: metallophosphoesterase, partial [Candidatus Fermentibacteraceae bacterium]|nr:metallophosphoesterase [Candidatus Fermentibacteraceae bacterium]